jgi:hypothetical protein
MSTIMPGGSLMVSKYDSGMGANSFGKEIFKIACVLLCVLLAPLFSGCDYSIQSVRFDFVQLPRIVYIAGVDTELDFADATLVPIMRNGNQLEEFPLLLELERGWWLSMSTEHSVDFETPYLCPEIIAALFSSSRSLTKFSTD